MEVNKVNIFLKSFKQFGEVGLSSRLFSIYQSAPITEEPIMSSFQCLIFFERVNKGEPKMVNLIY